MERPGLKKGTKIAVAMSGGLDSSVAVLILKDAGFQPVGITLRFWVDPRAEKLLQEGDPSSFLDENIQDARKVAETLDIPHFVLNMEEDFYEKVVTYFLCEYTEGRTPNPCIPCNRYLKFSLLLQKARSMGIQYLATGHYARNIYCPSSGRYKLLQGKDRGKDQSYFLYTLTQQQLCAALFPLGEFTKEEIRQKARKAGLKVAEKKESQEICFIPDNNYRGFLKRYRPHSFSRGDILSTSGEKLGEHSGLPFYTIGQRKGLRLTSTRPLYVVGMDSCRNALIVGNKEEIFNCGLVAGDLNFISGEDPGRHLPVQVKVRYRSPAISAILYPPENGEAKVIFEESHKAVTPGQAAVFYSDEEVLGGGTIQRALR